MNSPKLSKLPPALAGKTGWPWTEKTPALPPSMPDGSPWPRVSIVTPSYNQGQYIEETIRSVLLQGYPNLEYIIMDGGSTDGSVEIIRKYEPWLTYWESETDRGQAHAINKGWQRSNGEILAWLNSDDVYTKGAIKTAIKGFYSNPSSSVIYSDLIVIDENSNHKEIITPEPYNAIAFLMERSYIPQPTVFIKHATLNTVGLLDEKFYMMMDLDLYLRIGLQKNIVLTYLHGVTLACYRWHNFAKSATNSDENAREKLIVLDKVFNRQDLPEEILSNKNNLYRKTYFENALVEAKRMKSHLILTYLAKAFSIDPRYIIQRPVVILYLIKQAIIGLFTQFNN